MKPIAKHMLLFLFGLLSITFLINCSKDDPAPTVEELLTSGTWYVESQTGIAANDCQKHSNYRFLTSGAIIVEAFTVNSDGECVSIADSGNWELTSDTEILIKGSAETYLTIVNITEKELVLSNDDITLIFDKNPGTR